MAKVDGFRKELHDVIPSNALLSGLVNAKRRRKIAQVLRKQF